MPEANPSFNAKKDKIAITVPEFTVKKTGESGPFRLFAEGRFQEPYLVSLAIDEKGATQSQLNFNFNTYPNVQVGTPHRMIGDGSLVYGPSNPGEFVAVSILLMESDEDVRTAGNDLKAFIESEAAKLGMKAALAAAPNASIAIALIKELTGIVATRLSKDRDDVLGRAEGVFFRNRPVPYGVNREFIQAGPVADITVRVLPLTRDNGQGPLPATIPLGPA